MAAPRSVLSCDPAFSRGRLYPEPPSPTRSAFRRDCDRVIHSTAFRRLKHKTQVFVFHEGDHYRTRLTHSLEVAQIARALARQLGLDEDLTETLALAHDLGHPPFGHAGERALNACLAGFGGFDHNAQALRVVTALEHRYPAFVGLNLTWETLEGIVKHNGPLAGTAAGGEPLPLHIAGFDALWPLDLSSHASLEAQVAAVSDDIAYNAHDIDDGLRAGLFTIDDLTVMPVPTAIIAAIDRRFPGLDNSRRGAELVRDLISMLIGSVFTETRRRLAIAGLASADAVRAHGEALVGLDENAAEAQAMIKTFLHERMYRHPKVMLVMSDAAAIVTDLFARYRSDPGQLPDEGRAAAADSEAAQARQIGDFIAGMTDRFAMQEHQRLFDSTPELR
jgi:dGTPase